jgi:NADH-quinone oxidoreductase subunit B
MEFYHMSSNNTGNGNAPEKVIRRKPVPIAMAKGPHEYIPGDQELPVQLTSFLDMLQWAQNWPAAQSR